jgi:hypothetical protein
MFFKISNFLRWIVLVPSAIIVTGCVYLFAFGCAYVCGWLNSKFYHSNISLDEANNIYISIAALFAGYSGVISFISTANLIAPYKKNETVRLLSCVIAFILLVPIYFTSVGFFHIKSSDKSFIILLWSLISYLSSLYGLLPYALKFEFKYWKKNTLFNKQD